MTNFQSEGAKQLMYRLGKIKSWFILSMLVEIIFGLIGAITYANHFEDAYGFFAIFSASLCSAGFLYLIYYVIQMFAEGKAHIIENTYSTHYYISNYFINSNPNPDPTPGAEKSQQKRGQADVKPEKAEEASPAPRCETEKAKILDGIQVDSEGFIRCPNCNQKQKASRTSCLRCGTLFVDTDI